MKIPVNLRIPKDIKKRFEDDRSKNENFFIDITRKWLNEPGDKKLHYIIKSSDSAVNLFFSGKEEISTIMELDHFAKKKDLKLATLIRLILSQHYIR